MKAWFYKLIGSDAEVPWADGTDLPENVQLGNPDFLNQFIKRVNLRVAAMRMLGHSVSFAPEYGVGETYLNNLWSRCSDAISGPGAYYWNTTGPDGTDDDDDCYAVHGGFSGPGAGDASPQDWMRTLREEIAARTNVVRKPFIYNWVGSDRYYGPAGRFISGNGTWFYSHRDVANPDLNQDDGGTFNYPYTPDNYLSTLDGDLGSLVPVGRSIIWADSYGGWSNKWSAYLTNAVANLIAPMQKIGFTLGVYAKGLNFIGSWDYLSAELPVEGRFYEKAVVARVPVNHTAQQNVSLGCSFGSADTEETHSGSGSGKYQVLALLKIDIDESTTPD